MTFKGKKGIAMNVLEAYFRFFEKVDIIRKANPKIKSLKAVYPQLQFFDCGLSPFVNYVTPIEVQFEEKSFLKLNFFIC